MSMRLTKVQKEVLSLMKGGWALWKHSRQLNASTPLPDRYILQKNGRGKGGEIKTVSSKTVTVLLSKNMIAYVGVGNYELS